MRLAPRAAALLALAAPLAAAAPAQAALQPSTGQLVFSGKAGAGPTAARTVALTNTGGSNVTVDAVKPAGTQGARFQVTGTNPALPATLHPGQGVLVTVTFTPKALGPVTASLKATGSATAKVALGGIGTRGSYGAKEPSLQWILSAYGIKLADGDRDPSSAVFKPTGFPLGSEVVAPTFTAAGGTPTVQVLGVFSKQKPGGYTTRFGLYDARSGALGGAITIASPDQSVDPLQSGDAQTHLGAPGSPFGFWSQWDDFQGHIAYSQDAMNTWDHANMHKVRVYPLADKRGNRIANAYVLATEEFTLSYDWNDLVVILRHVQPA